MRRENIRHLQEQKGVVWRKKFIRYYIQTKMKITNKNKKLTKYRLPIQRVLAEFLLEIKRQDRETDH